jgi:prevent-host-death family protein
MAIVKIHDAKTNLSRLIARAETGEEIVIARDDEPVVRLTAIRGRRRFSSDAGAVRGVAETASEMRGLDRITIDPEVCGGKPCIRGMRIRVSDVVGLLASGMSRKQVLAEYPYLEPGDLDAALAYAAGSVNHRVIRTRE